MWSIVGGRLRGARRLATAAGLRPATYSQSLAARPRAMCHVAHPQAQAVPVAQVQGGEGRQGHI